NIFFAVSPTNFTIQPQRATVFVVRHAEKAAGDDPPLTDTGARRAQALYRLLASSHLDTVYASPARRALQTAQPTADGFGLTVQRYADVPALLAQLQAFEGGRHVLVVGHSNTVPQILQGLGVADPV